MIAVLVLALLGAGFLAWRALRNRGRRAEEARSLATVLVPEIRSVLASCDPASPSGGAPVERGYFASARQKLPTIMPAEALFAVETFYQCVDAYVEASKAMASAFAAESDLSLGDRIRAKDRRDRILKDVYYTGEGALERLQKLA